MKKPAAITILVCVMLAFLLALPLIETAIYTAQSDKIENEVQMLVTWKERVSYGKTYQYHYYLIFGELEDGTPCVLQNADSPPRKKYNGSDVYQQIHIGKIYTFFTTGERDYKRAQYPNIISILAKSDGWDVLNEKET